MDKNKLKTKQRMKRHYRIRAKVRGTKEAPRLSVFRSNKGLYVQLIDDEKGETLASASSKEVVGKSKVKSQKPKVKSPKSKVKRRNKQKVGMKLTRSEQAREVGKLIAKKALGKKIQKIVFDRSGYKYHGRVKAVAEGAREGGLKF